VCSFFTLQYSELSYLQKVPLKTELETHGKINGFIFRHVCSMHELRLCGVNRIIIRFISLVKLVRIIVFNYGFLL
jgi:hypothetical protein